ncbi:MAG: flagellar filament capping protein FliD [Gallionella sp.]|nr:flagellar filament capping protein FliD [Gallionella sp.]
MATTTSATTSTNIDVNSIVSQLMTVERQPITKLNTKEASYQAKLSAYGTVKSAVSSFQTALQSLGTSNFQKRTATASDSTVVSAVAASSSVTGTYSLEVSALAQSQKLVAAGQTSSTDAIGTGASTTITFDFGTISNGTLTNGVYSGASFTSNGATTQSITIDSSNNTLEGIRNAINAADMGVSATIVNDGSGTPYRLALSSDNSGISNSIKISTDGADAAIDTLLAHDPAGVQHFAETATAQNAAFKVNGVSISKTSNTVTDAIQGVTMTLSKLTTSPVTLSIANDGAAVSTAVSGFVKAYNDLNSTLKTLSAYNSTTKTGATLQGDATVRTIQSQLRGLLASAVTGAGSLSTLTDIGVTFQTDGSLAVNQTKLDSKISTNFADIASLFTSTTGYSTTLGSWATNVLSSDGLIASRTDGLGRSIKDIGTRRAELEARMISIERRYRTQFTNLDTMLSSMNQTSTYLTQQLANL